jgi:hypothetical protein
MPDMLWTVLANQGRYSQVKCACGTERRVQTYSIVSGKSLSCGCVRGKPTRTGYRLKETSVTEHPLYYTWKAMRRRCHDPKHRMFKNYGGRGISVCERWSTGDGKSTGFECFAGDMGERPDGMTLDRLDNEAGYSPSNCRWASAREQGLNTRRTRKMEVAGSIVAIADVAVAVGRSPQAIKDRLARGWTSAEVLSPRSHSDHRKLSDEVVEAVRKQYVAGSLTHGARALARQHGVHLATIQRALKGYGA